MDAPNAPNPTNPNTQDQFVDAVQGPAAQAQGPAAWDQAQGPAAQVQGPTAQGPANNNAQLVKMYPFSLHTNWPQHNQSPLVWWCLPIKYFIKIG